jgi:UDP-2,3-diacylglucosamine hydrolase
MAILLLSDLHLPDSASPLRTAFLQFLNGPARSAQAVYILGDLFNYWIDDDVGLEAYREEAQALRSLIAQGVPVYFMPGNRDFIIGKTFFAATGVQPLRDPTIVDFAGLRTELSHGDRYCTDDVGLQRWRRFSSLKGPQLVWHSLPLKTRRSIALWLRGRSKRKHRPGYNPQIMDVNLDAIVQAFANAGVARIIHGHTHRPAEHHVKVDGRDCERVVLSDWHGSYGEYLECDAAGLRRIPLAIPAADTPAR